MTWTPLFKAGSAKLERYARRQLRRQAKAKLDAKDDRLKAMAWTKIRKEVYLRDKAKCRASGIKLWLQGSNPFTIGHVHHCRYRSAGGEDVFENLLLLSPVAHQKEHDGFLTITLGPEGDAGRPVIFREYDKLGGRLLREWQG